MNTITTWSRCLPRDLFLYPQLSQGDRPEVLLEIPLQCRCPVLPHHMSHKECYENELENTLETPLFLRERLHFYLIEWWIIETSIMM
jgi:hypothetical protein